MLAGGAHNGSNTVRQNLCTFVSGGLIKYGKAKCVTLSGQIDLKRGYIEFKYYADAIHSGLTPPG